MSSIRHSIAAIIVIDDREPPELRAYFVQQREQLHALSIYAVSARLTHGDYTIAMLPVPTNPSTDDVGARNTYIVEHFAQRCETIIIERKTCNDFAQSIVDGRIANIPQMQQIAPNATSMLLVEGSAEQLCDRSAIVCGISAHAIRAKMNHLMLRNGIHIIESRDLMDTAQRLIDFARDARSLFLQPRTGSAASADTMCAQTIAPTVYSTLPVAPPSAQTIARDIFLALPGCGPVTVKRIMELHIPLYTLWEPNCAQQLSRGMIHDTPVPTPIRNKLSAIIREYQKGGQHTITINRAIFNAVPGISPTVAAMLASGIQSSTDLSNTPAAQQEFFTLDSAQMNEKMRAILGRTCKAIARKLYDALHAIN